MQPIFNWLINHGGSEWPEQLLSLATGITSQRVPSGPLVNVALDPEKTVPATASRLAWMLRNANALVPFDGRYWRDLIDRMANRPAVEAALAQLDAGQSKGLAKLMTLEGKTHADCLIDCEQLLIWIEGKRFDWLSPSTKWDVSRDQLARNCEAAWTLANAMGKDFRLLICHEHPLRHHETALINGYRAGTWSAGWPHVPEKQRNEFASRIGTVTWAQIALAWPSLQNIPELADLVLPLDEVEK